MQYKSMTFTEQEVEDFNLADLCKKETIPYVPPKTFYRADMKNLKVIKKVLKEKNITVKSVYSFSDPGHGWVKVKRSELEQLNLLDKITSYSYQKGEHVYLEEDCDASTYINALKEKHNNQIKILQIGYVGNKMSRIRNYSQFSCTD